MDEFYKRFRPKDFPQVLGQPDAVRVLTKMLEGGKVAHALLFNGPSGCGKTTLARIMCRRMGAARNDVSEINAANARGIDDVREIVKGMGFAPMYGKHRVWIIDEAHKLTSDAQTAFLKPLEDTPAHCYFMLCTTDPAKLLKTVLGRCTEVKLKAVGIDLLCKLVADVAEKEGLTLGKEVIQKIADVADGSARKALVLLNALVGITDEDEQLGTIAVGDYKKAGIELARGLMNENANWASVAGVLKTIDFENEDVEGLRYMVLYYANAILTNGKTSKRAANILYFFSKAFYDSKKAGLTLACWEVINAK